MPVYRTIIIFFKYLSWETYDFFAQNINCMISISKCNRPLSLLLSRVGISRPLTFPPCSLLRSPSLLSNAFIAWLTSPLLCCNALLAWEAENPISTILAMSLSWPTCNTVKQWRMLHVRVSLWVYGNAKMYIHPLVIVFISRYMLCQIVI